MLSNMLKRTILITVALTLAHHATAADAPSSPQPATARTDSAPPSPAATLLLNPVPPPTAQP